MADGRWTQPVGKKILKTAWIYDFQAQTQEALAWLGPGNTDNLKAASLITEF